jgi:hypothetical protein
LSEIRQKTNIYHLVAALEKRLPCDLEGIRLLSYSDQRLSELRGVWNHSFEVLIGEESALPWLEQISYYGKHPHSPHLYTPTQLVCSLNHDIVQRLVLAQYRNKSGNGNYVLDPVENASSHYTKQGL